MRKHAQFDERNRWDEDDIQEWQEEGEEEEGQYKTYTNYMRVSEQKRAQLLDILQRNADLSNAQIAKLTQLSRTKIAQIRREYDLTGDVRVTQGCNHKSLQKQQMEEKQKEAILAIISQNPRCGLKDIIDRLAAGYGLFLRRSSVHKRLTRDLGYAYQPVSGCQSVIRTENDQETVFSRGLFCASLRGCTLEGLFVVAAAPFSGSWSQDCAWLPRSQTPLSVLPGGETPDSVQLLVTLGMRGIVRFDVLEGALTVQALTDHLKRGLCSRPKQDGHKLLVAPELLAGIVDLESVKAEGNPAESIFQALKIDFLKLPPHSPKISPGFLFFEVAQKKFRAYRTLKKKVNSKESVRGGLKEVMALMPAAECPSYFRRVAQYLTVRSPKDVKLSFFIQN